MSNIAEIKPHKGFQEKLVRTNVNICFGGGVLAAGKRISVNELILTPNGWKRWGDIQVGDVVCSPFHGTTKVTYVTPPDVFSLYRLETSDGRSVLAHDEHLWYVRKKSQLNEFHKKNDITKNYSIFTTKQLMDGMAKGEKYYIPTPHAFYAEEKDFIIPPYVLGVLIGDGYLPPASEKHSTLNISSDEEDIIKKCAELLGVSYRMHSERNYTCVLKGDAIYQINKEIVDLGLNVKSPYRFIPEKYKWGSVEQRKQLLAGLFDTDGHICVKNNSCALSYSTTSKKLYDDVVELCRGLGYIVTTYIDRRANKYTSGASYQISIQTHDKIFSSAKHTAMYFDSSTTKNPRKWNHVYIKSITYEKEGLATCITVDDPEHLYITSDFIVSHNTFGAVLSVAECVLDPLFRGLFLRNNMDDLKAGGGLVDTFKDVYGEDYIKITSTNTSTYVRYPSGAIIELTHVADQTREVVDRRFKGRQYDFIYFDEGTGFTWECFTSILSRLRGKSKYAGHLVLTTNPEREHWIRKFIDWYIDAAGQISPERDGRIRYFYNCGVNVEDIVWGNSKEEVYHKCKGAIDNRLQNMGLPITKWPSFILSFTFYLGKMSENTEMLENNEDYLGIVAAAGGAEAAKKLDGNWNVSSKDDSDNVISAKEAMSPFEIDPQTNGDRWVTCDLADVGTDNVVMLAWNGLHVEDMRIITHSTPKENANALKIFAAEHDVADPHIIYDGVRAAYMRDYIPNATEFISNHSPIGLYKLQYMKLKDECYGKLVYLLKNEGISVADHVAKMQYVHQKLKNVVYMQDEFVSEVQVIHWVDVQNGKKRLMTKKEMNKLLGKGRSMDLADPFAMRMYPMLNIAEGYELENGRKEVEFSCSRKRRYEYVNIYDESFTLA